MIFLNQIESRSCVQTLTITIFTHISYFLFLGDKHESSGRVAEPRAGARGSGKKFDTLALGPNCQNGPLSLN